MLMCQLAEEGELPMLLKDHYIPSSYTYLACLQLLQVTTTHYEIQSSIIQMLPPFYGLNNDDLYNNLDEFL